METITRPHPYSSITVTGFIHRDDRGIEIQRMVCVAGLAPTDYLTLDDARQLARALGRAADEIECRFA
jgi:hypothetical protein